MRVGREALQEVGAQLQRARAAQGLHGDGAFFGDDRAVGAEHQFLHCLVVCRQAIDRQIGARGGFFGQAGFGLLDAVEQRHTAVVVVVDAHAQVHFIGILVGVEGLGNAEDGVARRHVDGGKELGRLVGVHRDNIESSLQSFACSALGWETGSYASYCFVPLNNLAGPSSFWRGAWQDAGDGCVV